MGTKQALLDTIIHTKTTHAHHLKLTIMTLQSHHHYDIQETPKFDWKNQNDLECSSTIHEWQNVPAIVHIPAIFFTKLTMDEFLHLHLLIDCGGNQCAYRVHHHDHTIVLKLPK
jgi:hypothetical protein